MKDLNNKIPPLERMGLFAAVVESKSISEAARNLKVSKSSISQRLQNLEQELQVNLFQRSVRGVSLTIEGEAFYSHCKEMLSSAQKAIDSLRGIEEQSGTLYISCPAGIIDQVIIPIMTEFLEQNPGVDFRTLVSDDILDYRKGKIDIAFRFGWIDDGEFIALKLAQYKDIFCASPDYLAKHPKIEKPSDLKKHSFIGFHAFGEVHTYKMKNEHGEEAEVKVPCRITATASGSLKRWAVSGAGVLRMPDYLIKEELEKGELEIVLEGWSTQPDVTLFAAFHKDPYRPAHVNRFIQFLKENKHRFSNQN